MDGDVWAWTSLGLDAEDDVEEDDDADEDEFEPVEEEEFWEVVREKDGLGGPSVVGLLALRGSTCEEKGDCVFVYFEQVIAGIVDVLL